MTSSLGGLTERTGIDETPEPSVASAQLGVKVVRSREDGLEAATEDEGEDLEEQA